MPSTRHFILILVATLCLAVPALACLWDNDTLRDERRGLPGVAEILAGRFERHSAFFYRERVKRMEARLAADPNDLAAYDNLAVAHEKLGDADAAIAVILRKDKLKPGEYTTHANLGTFYLHKGEFENGVAHVRRAIQINPDAHFGRETFQLQAAEYLRRAKVDAAVFDEGSFVLPVLLGLRPNAPKDVAAMTPQERRDAYAGAIEVLRSFRGQRDVPAVDDAIEGIVGMIRFGTGTSPHLYFALGDLLAARGDKHLAYRAYKRALDHGHPRPAMVTDALIQVKGMVERPAAMEEAVIVRERAAADAWLAAYQAYEDALVRTGKDTDAEANYAAFYKQHPREMPAPPSERLALPVSVMIAGGVIAAGFGWLVWRGWSAKKRPVAAQPAR